MSPLLRVAGLCVDIGQGPSSRRVVDHVSLSIDAGECLGMVGESGSGKSMTARSVIGLLPSSARVTSGVLEFADPSGRLASYDATKVRGHGIAMVFQEPMTALNPTRRVIDSIADGVIATTATRVSRSRARDLALDLMAEVGIPDAPRRARAFPHELSGGLRQRVMIAMALSGNPRLLLCDEPTTALDVTVQDQILGLLDRLRENRGLGLLFVSHDLGVIAQVSQRVAVMHDGRIVEEGRTTELLARPSHSYTASLRAAAAMIDGEATMSEVV